MSRVLALLEDEHRRIERVLAGLAWTFRRPDPGRADGRGVLLRHARFLRDFADRAHHGKEEGLLFDGLRRHGVLPDCGPINRYLEEHARGRELVANLVTVGEGEGALGDDADRVSETVERLVSLYRVHIAREDGELFPAVRAALPPPALEELDRRLDRLDRSVPGSPDYDRLVAEGEALAGPRPAEVPHAIRSTER